MAHRVHHHVQRRPVLEGVRDVRVPEGVWADRLIANTGCLGRLLYDAVDGALG